MPTWAGLKGRIIDELYVGLFEEIARYVTCTKLDQFYVVENLQQYAGKAVAGVRKEIEQRRPKLRDPPDDQETDGFLKELWKIFRYESQLCGALLDYKISSKKDIRLKSEFVLLFPFNLKCKIVASDLGFSGSAEPDFIYSSRVVGDIKTGSWRDSFELTLAAYALAYENETRRKMNLGIIVNPALTDSRTVPLHMGSEIRIIEDVVRKAVLVNRDRRLATIRDNVEPPLPEQKDICQPCGYYDDCWTGGSHA
jgi:CRISPR/Cas system-associated exonuclease Cas4 (RecB family)